MSQPKCMIRGGRDPIWIPTATLTHTLSKRSAELRRFLWCMHFKPRVHEGELIAGRVIPVVEPLSEHPTFRFVAELARGASPFETDLWRAAQTEVVKRRDSHGKRIILADRDTFTAYSDRVKAMLAYTARHGVQPVRRMFYEEHSDVEIGIAVMEQGIFQYRKGHHRLACAMVLGVKRIPIGCYFATRRGIAALCGGNLRKGWQNLAAERLQAVND